MVLPFIDAHGSRPTRGIAVSPPSPTACPHSITSPPTPCESICSAIYYSTGAQPCFRNDDCLYGQFCAMHGAVFEASDSAVYGNMCAWCSWGGPNDEAVGRAACSSSNRNTSFELWVPPGSRGIGSTAVYSAADLENFCE